MEWPIIQAVSDHKFSRYLPDAGKSAVMPPVGRCIEIFVEVAAFPPLLLLLVTLVVVTTGHGACETYCTFVIGCGTAVIVAMGGCWGAAERTDGATTWGCAATWTGVAAGLSSIVEDGGPVRYMFGTGDFEVTLCSVCKETADWKTSHIASSTKGVLTLIQSIKNQWFYRRQYWRMIRERQPFCVNGFIFYPNFPTNLVILTQVCTCYVV